MKFYFNLAALFLIAAAAGYCVESVRNAATIGTEMKACFNSLNSALDKKSLTKEELEKADALYELMLEMKGAYRKFYGSDEETWNRFCDQSLKEIASLKLHLKEQELKPAQQSFDSIRKLQKVAHETFRPGALKRIFKFLKRKKKNKEIASNE